MAPGAKGLISERMMLRAVGEVANGLGLQVQYKVPCGQHVWGKPRKIDVVLTHCGAGGVFLKRLAVECIYQGGTGSAKKKIYSMCEDIMTIPIPSVVVYGGPDFNAEDVAVLSAKSAVLFDDLEIWLRFYFGFKVEGNNSLPLSEGEEDKVESNKE